MFRLKALAAAISCLSLLVGANCVGAAEITVLSVPPVKDAVGELILAFQRFSGHSVSITFQSPPELTRKIQQGMAVDLVITLASQIEELIKEGKLVGGSRTEFVRSGVGVAVRTGAQKPDISTPEAFKNALLAAKSIGISQGSSGVYVMSVMQRLGIAEQVKAKVVRSEVGQPVGPMVASGHVEIGLQQLAELLPIPGIDLVGPLPAELQTRIVYATAIPASTRERRAAEDLARFLSSESARPILIRRGFEPG